MRRGRRPCAPCAGPAAPAAAAAALAPPSPCLHPLGAADRERGAAAADSWRVGAVPPHHQRRQGPGGRGTQPGGHCAAGLGRRREEQPAARCRTGNGRCHTVPAAAVPGPAGPGIDGRILRLHGTDRPPSRTSMQSRRQHAERQLHTTVLPPVRARLGAAL